jgi:hypothetical protein
MRLSYASLALLSLPTFLASCVGPPSAPRPATPAPVAPTPSPAPSRPAPPPPAPVEWQYRAVAPGDWRYQADANGSSATYGASPATPALVLRCDRTARQISLSRIGATTGSALAVRTSYGATSWPAVPVATPSPRLTAARAASDSVLDQIAYSRGKIAVEVPGTDMLIVPAWAELSRVVEDCR